MEPHLSGIAAIIGAIASLTAATAKLITAIADYNRSKRK